jgi:hypothetical protein
MNTLHQHSKQINGAAIPARVDYDVDVCTCSGSVGLMPKSRDAQLYCAQALAGWALFGGVYFIPRQSADIVLRTLTKRFSCRIDGEVVS